MTVGKFTKRKDVQSCGHSVENIDVELTRKWNKDFLGIDQMTCRLMAHKSKEIFDKTGMKAQMNNLTFLQHSIEMRVHDDNKDKSFIFRM